MRDRPRRALLLLVALVLAVGSTVLLNQPSADARGSELARCQQFRTDSVTRTSLVSGSGVRVVVIGDSWSAGLGQRDPRRSWPSRLPGRVEVFGFSGSGYSAGASHCGRVSFADRAAYAVRGGADLVVVQGGLNDVDQPTAAVRAGFEQLLRRLEGLDVVVVGPAAAPARARGVPRIDDLLARLAAEHDVAYVATSDLRADYLPDRLHLSAAGHAAYGDAVAARLEARGLAPGPS